VFLQDTQQSDLGFGRKLPGFVEEDRASFGKLLFLKLRNLLILQSH
jgi:hypothetical protein